MPFQIIREDITKLKCDAIVNAANSELKGGGGVDGAIHRAAGEQLAVACKLLGHCEVGEAKITKGYDLPAEYVIHTVGPRYIDGGHNEAALLRSCYEKALALAVEYQCQSVAFPLIAAGSYGYPKEAALHIAVDAIKAFLADHELTVFLAVFDKASFRIGESLFDKITEYINDRYAEIRLRKEKNRSERVCTKALPLSLEADIDRKCCFPEYGIPKGTPGLEAALKNIDESFSQMLIRKIDEKGLTDAECYKKANIDRKLFSKIRNNPQYKPKKVTALAFAIALELSLEETQEMLKKAGYALSHSNKFDIIIEYFIAHGNYDIFEINNALFAFDQILLGC